MFSIKQNHLQQFAFEIKKICCGAGEPNNVRKVIKVKETIKKLVMTLSVFPNNHVMC